MIASSGTLAMFEREPEHYVPDQHLFEPRWMEPVGLPVTYKIGLSLMA